MIKYIATLALVVACGEPGDTDVAFDVDWSRPCHDAAAGKTAAHVDAGRDAAACEVRQ